MGQAQTSLIFAAENGDIAKVRTLLAAGCDVHANHDDALQKAAGNGHAQMVCFLLSVGADVHGRNGLVLRLAACSGNDWSACTALNTPTALIRACNADRDIGFVRPKIQRC